MTHPNAHVEIREEWPLIGGSPALYLNCLRDAKTANSTFPPGCIPRPDGKLGFAQFIAANGGRTVRTIATVTGGVARSRTVSGDLTAMHYLEQLAPGQYFCKPNHGGNGRGAFLLAVTQNGMNVAGAQMPIARIAEQLSSKDYLLQDWLVPAQHLDIARFNPSVINTLRLVTFAFAGGAKPVAATMRLASGNGAVDNWSAGGVAVPVTLDRFTLGEYGVLKDSLAIVTSHPQSGIAFRDQPIPHAGAAATMACRLHNQLAIASIGWDIALLSDGPCILESNASWDTNLAAQLNPDFLAAFFAFHLARPEMAMRFEFKGEFADRKLVRRWLTGAAGVGLASGRVEHFSGNRLNLVLSSSSQGLESAIRWIKSTASQCGIATMRQSRCEERLPPGLDISATFSDSL